ncbi:MAG: efflux RND transporter permease subunit [Candidatus Delongbacteria bacterium]
MLKTILSRPITVIMVFTAITLFGIISYNKLPVNLLPDIKYPSLTVWTELEGSSPEQVERLVTEPLEASIAGLKDIISIKSESKESISLITIDFSWGTDMDFAVLYLREKLDAATLPDTAGRPNILRVDPAAKPIMILSISGSDQKTVRDISEHIIKKRIEQTEGVAMADVIGGEETEIRIEADIEKLNTYGITFNSVISAVRSASTNSPGGTVKDDVYIYDLVISSEFESLTDIENTLVKQLENRRNIYLKDVAEVSYRSKEKRSFTRYNSEPSTAILIRKDGDANAVTVVKLVKEITDELNRTLDVKINTVYDQSEFITDSINNVVQAILLGGILSFLTLFLFLREFRSPFNIALAMPISIFSTFTLLYFSKISLNLMSLSGFALGIGMLVDNSIVVLENIDRKKRETADVFTACWLGVKEVILPVSASTFTTIIVFMPVVFVSGVAGELFKDQSVSVAFALISSLFVSVTLVPVLYNKFSMGNKKQTQTDESIKEDNGPIFKTGIYWTILVLVYFGVVSISKIPVDESAFVFILFLAVLTDPFIKTIEFIIFHRKDDGLPKKAVLRTIMVNSGWLLLLLLLTIPSAYIAKIDYFEPVHALLASVGMNFLNGFESFLYDISSFINELFQPYEEELSTKTFMLYAYILGGITFFVNLLGLFNHRKFYGFSKGTDSEVFQIEGIRRTVKGFFRIVFGFIVGLFIFYFKTSVSFIKIISKPVLKIFDSSYSYFEDKYHSLLTYALDHKARTFTVSIIAFVLSGIILAGMEKRVMPEVDGREFILSVELNPGTSIWTTESVIMDFEQMILSKEGTLSVFATGGISDEKSLLTGATVYKGDLQVKLEENITTAQFISELRNDIDQYNRNKDINLKINFNTDVSVLGDMIQSEEGDLSVKVFGSDLADLKEISEKVTLSLRSTGVLSEIKSDFSGSKPQIIIDFNDAFLEDNNITESEISSFIKASIKGETATQITENNKTVDIIVGTSEDFNENIKNLTGATYKKGGKSYPVSSLININYYSGPESIKHQSQGRVITVTASLTSGRLDRAVEKVKEEIGKIPLYRGMRIEVGGQNEEMQDSMIQIIFMFLLSFVLVYMVLASQFESLLSPLIIVLSVPFAFVGVALGLLVTGQTINILSGIGMIMLIGIVVNDAIVKIDFIENSVRDGMSVREAIYDASRKRLRPILMTTITTVFGMIPMAISYGGSSELRKPLAVTVIFGLSFATLLTLVILPVIYEAFKRK